jgi:DNA-directed RNA polymerase subunit L
MKVNVLENNKDKLKIEVETVTLANLLNEGIWKQKVDYSAYNVDHPYLSKPVIVIKGGNPKKALFDAADQILKDVKDMKKQVTKG